MKRVMTILTIASAFASCAAFVLMPLTYDVQLVTYDSETGLSPSNSVEIASNCRCGFSRGRIWLYSHDVPYNGSIRYLDDGHGGVYFVGGHAKEIRRDWVWKAEPFVVIQESYIGDDGDVVGVFKGADLPGIYYRNFIGFNVESPYWTLRVTLWYPVLTFAILPTIWAIRHRRWWMSKLAANGAKKRPT